MEETKEVKMEPKAVTAQPHPEKVSYEQMVNIANQLQSQNRELVVRLNNLADIYHRLDYLFKVIANADKFDITFVEKCVKEIEGIMTIPEQSEQPDSSESSKD